jgi:hypothetical protein
VACEVEKGGDIVKSVQRILSYNKQLVLYALYDILDSEESEYAKAENGCIAAKVTVYGNRSGFALSVSEQPPSTVLTVQTSAPCEGLSEQGKLRAADYLADRVEQLLENELKMQKHENGA